MIVTDQLRERLRRYLREHRLTQKELGRQLGCSGPTVSRWLTGEVNQVSQQHAARLVELLDITVDPLTVSPRFEARSTTTVRNTPALREFLMREMLTRGYDLKAAARLAGYDKPETLKRLLAGELDFYPAMLSGLLRALDVDFAAAPLSPHEREALHACYEDGWQTRDAPVLTMAHAAECRTVNGIFELPEFWDADRVPVPTDGRRYVAFRVDGESMAPRIAAGDIVLCDLDANVANGNVVVAKFRDQVLCKRYLRRGGRILLTSDNPASGEDFDLGPDDVDWLVRAVRTSSEL